MFSVSFAVLAGLVCFMFLFLTTVFLLLSLQGSFTAGTAFQILFFVAVSILLHRARASVGTHIPVRYQNKIDCRL